MTEHETHMAREVAEIPEATQRFLTQSAPQIQDAAAANARLRWDPACGRSSAT